MSDQWDLFWLCAAWAGLLAAGVLVFVGVVWLITRMIGDEPASIMQHLPPTPMYAYTREPAEQEASSD